MRIKIMFAIAMVLLLTNCTKSPPNNFTCLINGAAFTGNATTYFNGASGADYFQVILNSGTNSSIVLEWMNIDSIAAERNITVKAYNFTKLPPFVISASYTNINGSVYIPTNSGGFTVTNNTGPGGIISGTFNFNAVNESNSSDSVVITQGIFTNIPVVSS